MSRKKRQHVAALPQSSPASQLSASSSLAQRSGLADPAGESARKFYESARLELIQRLQLRDNALFVYLGVTGTIFGVAIGTNVKPELLLIIPFLSLAVGSIALQHHEVIASLGAFVAEEVGPFLLNLRPSQDAPQWDTSAALHSFFRRIIVSRSAAHWLILFFPGVAALITNWWHFYPIHWKSDWKNGYLWIGVVGIICQVTLARLLWTTHKFRIAVFSRFPWKTTIKK